jgi:hypothetical protein
MTSLSSQQKQLLFDYCIGLTSGEEAAEVESLISCNKEAAEIQSKLTSALAPLQSLEFEPCPDSLVESTVERLKMASASQSRLQQLLATEQVREFPGRTRLWVDLGKRLATAAVFMIVGTVVVVAFNVMSSYARQKAWQQGCMAQQSRIFDGLTQYTSDHDGRLPTVAAAVDAPWWKVGDQGNENHSNTRALWLLVKLNYTRAADFVCLGASRGKVVELDTRYLPEYHDFPGRQYITYSFRIPCARGADGRLVCQKVLMADSNPLFENLPDDYSESLRLRLTSDLLKLNSSNHRRRGQNVLFEDGRAEFIRARRIGIFEDDIYTLRGRDVYHGTEVPACASDCFLAP